MKTPGVLIIVALVTLILLVYRKREGFTNPSLYVTLGKLPLTSQYLDHYCRSYRTSPTGRNTGVMIGCTERCGKLCDVCDTHDKDARKDVRYAHDKVRYAHCQSLYGCTVDQCPKLKRYETKNNYA